MPGSQTTASPVEALKFDEIGVKDDHLSGAIYIKKGMLSGVRPARIRVTIEILEVQD